MRHSHQETDQSQVLQLCINCTPNLACLLSILTVVVMQNAGSCDMTMSLLADDPDAYMLKMCSPGYYGPLCSLCLLHNAPPGQARYGRTGNLNCQKCRSASALSCNLLHCHASCCLCLARFGVALLLPCAVLCCAVLCCAVLCCAVLCCAVLCCAVLCCAVLCCAVLCCAVLCCAVPCC